MSGEHFLLRTVGGPHARTFVVAGPWPLPDVLDLDYHLGLKTDAVGRYVKVSESQLPPMPADGHVMRGAQYEWAAPVVSNVGAKEQKA